MLDSIDSLIQHLKSKTPYDGIGTNNLWRALKYLDDRAKQLETDIRLSEDLVDITSRVTYNANVSIIFPWTDLSNPGFGIKLIRNHNVAIMNFDVHPTVSVNVPSIEFHIPNDIIQLSDTAGGIANAYGYLKTGDVFLRIGMAYQSQPDGNKISFFNNNFSPWLVADAPYYFTGQITLLVA